MLSTRTALVWALCVGALAVAAAPGEAYIYDGGQPQHLGIQVADNSSTVWVAEPFILAQDCYATALGAAVARAIGPINAGFSAWLYTIGYVSHVPESPIAQTTQPLVPLNTQYVYYDQPLASPVLLTANTPYAVILKPTDPTFTGSISWAVLPGTYYGQGTGDYGKSWQKLSLPLAVRIDGQVVPEPASLTALAAGVAALALYRRKTAA